MQEFVNGISKHQLRKTPLPSICYYGAPFYHILCAVWDKHNLAKQTNLASAKKNWIMNLIVYQTPGPKALKVVILGGAFVGPSFHDES